MLPDLERKTVQNFLESYPYQRFPLVVQGEVRGILSRGDLKSALLQNKVPVSAPPVLCGPELSVREVGSLLMESQSGMVIVQDERTGELMTVVTLHDLLRAQAALSE